MNARDIFEEGDTGEAILPIVPVSAQAERFKAAEQADKVSGKDAWLPEGDEPVYGDVRHHRERIDQLKKWVTYWKAKAETSGAEARRLRQEIDECWVPLYHATKSERDAALAGEP